MERSEILQAYAALPPFPEFPGEREWVDRLRSVDDFLDRGPIVADDLRTCRGFDDRLDIEELERRRTMFPQLWALLFRAFPPDPLS